MELFVFTPPTKSTPAQQEIYRHAAGVALTLPWSYDNLPENQGGWEKSDGKGGSAGYDFHYFDRAIRLQLDMGAKSVVTVLSPISFGGVNKMTPNYVFTPAWANKLGVSQLYTAAGSDYKGSGRIKQGSCAQGVDNTAFPACWMPAFQVAWCNAVNAALGHMMQQDYAQYIHAIRVGGGAGGEWFPWATSSTTPGLLTVPGGPRSISDLLPVWLDYMVVVHAAIIANGAPFRRIQSINGGFATQQVPYNYAIEEAKLAVSNDFGIGMQGLKQADIAAFEQHGRESGGENVSGYTTMDSAYIFDIYQFARPLEVQTSTASSPTGDNATGSLVTLLPYASNILRATNTELYYDDWRIAFDEQSPYYEEYGAAYRDAFEIAGAHVTA